MHALITVLTKNAKNIRKIINDFSYDEDDGDQTYYWDYANVGGRFYGLIPVKENTKVKIYANVFGMPYMEDEFHFQDMDYEHAQGVKYVSCARLRNIDYTELNRMKTQLGYDIFNPYAFIVDDDGDYTWVDNDTAQDLNELAWVRSILTNPGKQYWYVIIVDCHY